eukprot:5656748-Prymnesium_polylepis.2
MNAAPSHTHQPRPHDRYRLHLPAELLKHMLLATDFDSALTQANAMNASEIERRRRMLVGRSSQFVYPPPGSALAGHDSFSRAMAQLRRARPEIFQAKSDDPTAYRVHGDADAISRRRS